MVMDTNKSKNYRSKKVIMRNIIGTFLLGLVLFSACKKEVALPEASRLFRPVSAKVGLYSPSNYIEAKWQVIKDAVSYTVEISRDTFKTVDVTLTIDSSYALFENLKYAQLYQVHVRANALDSTKSSKYSYLGDIKTPKFPTILNTPTISDFTDAAVRMSWVASGAAVTKIRVYLNSNRTTLVKEVTLSASDITNQYRIVTGLQGSTAYYMELYSNTTLRGYDLYTTKAPFSGIVIDLRDISGRPSVLQDTLPLIPSGSTVILKKGLTYNIAATTSLSKTVTITSGDDLSIQDPAVVFFSSNFNFVAGSTIDSLVFKNIVLRGSDYAGKYVFNTTASANVGKISFQNCTAEIFRGVIRLQSGTTTVNDINFNNCVIDSISNYGVVNVDNAACKALNISFTNSTIYKVEKFITSSKQSGNSVLVNNCTFNEAPLSGNYFIDYNAQLVTSGIKITNCIFGIGKNKAGATTVNGVRATGSSLDASNNYAASDYLVSLFPIPNMTQYTKPTAAIFQSPATGNFKLIDTSFPGRNTAGDPRWR